MWSDWWWRCCCCIEHNDHADGHRSSFHATCTRCYAAIEFLWLAKKALLLKGYAAMAVEMTKWKSLPSTRCATPIIIHIRISMHRAYTNEREGESARTWQTKNAPRAFYFPFILPVCTEISAVITKSATVDSSNGGKKRTYTGTASWQLEARQFLPALRLPVPRSLTARLSYGTLLHTKFLIHLCSCSVNAKKAIGFSCLDVDPTTKPVSC